MIQKATWFIPGLLVTLLLGLLWAMPAFAADAGEISFLNGDDEISFISLNGFAGQDGADEDDEIDGFMAQVEDQDLNAPTEYKPGKAGRIEGNDVRVNGTGHIDWTNLADSNSDGKININDIKVFDAETEGTEDTGRGNLELDVTNGDLEMGTGGEWLEFELNEQTTIGAFVSTPTMSGAGAQSTEPDPDNVGGQRDIANTVDFTVPSDDDRLREENGSPSWLSVLADPDGDGNLVEHITATANVPYMVDNPTSDTVTDTQAADEDAQVSLKVSLVELETDGDLTGYTVRVSAAGVSVQIPDDVDGDTGAPITSAVDVVIVDDGGDVNINTTDNITLSYPTVYQGMGHMNQIGLVSLESGGGSRTSVAMRETSAVSGKFQATVRICDSNDDAEDDTPTVVCSIGQAGTESATATKPGAVSFPVDAAGDSITVRYSDASPRTTRTSIISLDNGVPAFGEMSPASGTAGKNSEPDVTFDVVDAESGISGDDESTGFEDTIRIVAGLFEADSDEMNPIDDAVIVLSRTDDLTVDEVTDGYTAEARIREGDDADDELDAGDSDEYEIRWWAVAVDSAGNTGVSDSNADTECTYSGAALPVEVDEDGVVTNGSELIAALMVAKNTDDDAAYEENCDPNVIRVDTSSPELVSATTGIFFDDDEDNDEGTGSLTSVVARFNESLDCDSVSADDFEVNGSAPNDVTCKGSNIYLSVDEMDSNDTPNVEVAEEAVADRAGNLVGADQEEEAEDGIPAGLTVTITGTAEGTRVVTKGEVTITITSDERLKGRPDVAIQLVGDDYALGSDEGNSAAPTGNTDEWSITRTLDKAGLYNVYVTAEDRVNSGESKAGVETFDSETIKKGKAFLFEVDNDVTEPKFTPESDGSTDNAGIFIRADFFNEGNEYGLAEAVEVEVTAAVEDDEDTKDVDESKDAVTKDVEKVVTTPGDVDTDFDTHSTVTLVSATFNDEDVTDDVITRDNILFVYRPGNLTNGEHTFEIEVEDNAGTEKTFSTTFEKIDKPDYKLDINPGPNLVSFPADPANGDINAVFGGEGNEDISTVLTYDNTSGLWLTATKGADGMFMGDLTTINGMNGYWVVADGIVDVGVLLEGSDDFTSPPPHIAVAEGWNLIGVVDTDQKDAGTAISKYFANIKAEVVYGFDSFESKLVRQSTDDDVETGKGYWVFANEAGIIIP